ncbi:TerD family protein [Nocardia anaemiae]|uniref:TerD family protein n=1 Tax=Nocardia anaemiae TaxID=263910 RepID=UPI0007C6AB73|nr:TerD family protein [Nocardia anaemiae]
MKLSKGANAAVPTSLLAVVVSWRSGHAVDAHALLLAQAGTVRTDRDLVFFNAPRHMSQAVTLDQEPAPGTARLSVSLPRTEPDVARIVVAGSVDDGTFGDIADLTLTIEAAHGPIAQFEITDPDAVSAMMFGEFYRRDGQWRFRAIGQGWASGLPGLVTEFGVAIEDHAEPTPDRSHVERTTIYPVQQRVSTGTALAGPRQLDNASRSQDGTRTDPTEQHDRLDAPGRPRTLGTNRADQAWHHTAATGPRDRAAHRPDSADERPARPRPGRPVDLQRQRHDVEPVIPAPPNPERADWHSDPENTARMRWWDGAEWTSATYEQRPPGPRSCERCGNPRRRKLFGGLAPCQSCAHEIEEFLTHWHTQAWRVLTAAGPRGAEWDALWASLRYQRIDEGLGRAALRDVALTYVERLVAFAFADGEIEQTEFEAFEYAIEELALSGPLVEDLRRRMYRGRTLSRLRGGDLPVVRTPGLHLDPEEKVHVDLPAVHVRQLARGPKLTDGRLIASNKKLRFVGTDIGTELPWNRVVSVHAEQRSVVVAATSSRGGATFDVEDPDYVAAALEGALRVAKRLVLTPGQRDTRSIPQEVKAEVWQRDGGKCVECGDGHYLEFDHIIPLSRGGATSATNLQILCRACNRAKGARI